MMSKGHPPVVTAALTLPKVASTLHSISTWPMVSRLPLCQLRHMNGITDLLTYDKAPIDSCQRPEEEVTF